MIQDALQQNNQPGFAGEAKTIRKNTRVTAYFEEIPGDVKSP
jgi:hypothetical protein